MVWNVIEGHLIKLIDGSIWEVKGFTHPPNTVIAYPRYIPYGSSYVKIKSLKSKLKILSERYGKLLVYDEIYDMMLPHIPKNLIAKVYDPRDKLKSMLNTTHTQLERLTVDFINIILDYSNEIDEECIGVTGSILVGLADETSDIDLIVYGVKGSKTIYSALKALRLEGITSPLKGRNLEHTVRIRSEDTSLQSLELESIRLLEGEFKGAHYSIKMLTFETEIPYGELKFKGLGEYTLRAKVLCDDYKYMIPWPYKLQVLKPQKIEVRLYTLRMRFTEIFNQGDDISVHGRLEHVTFKDVKFYQIAPNGIGGYMVLESAIR